VDVRSSYKGNNRNNMHGATIKIVDAQQARLYNSYKNTKCKY